MDPMFSKAPKPKKPLVFRRPPQIPDIRPAKIFKESEALDWRPLLVAAFVVLMLVITVLYPMIGYGVTLVFGIAAISKHISARAFFILALIILFITGISLFLPGGIKDISRDLAPHIYLFLVFGTVSLIRDQ